ncbi:ATP-binding response regulator [Pedobacter puniceum]|uniref:histidine kinase n=1 Tax=Pedobacter puniceum TaxID=2666136 RepID=A0A7K0FQP6_9SPHI|nr:sensor histidine kinase [Pedobacter puniceum]MRX48289.1 response regulator [Pedobacter puniceum]
MNQQTKSFSQSVRGKIIIAAFFACIALGLAWATSKYAFNKMLGSFEDIAKPGERLRLVNELTFKIISLDQLQKAQALNNPGDYSIFLEETKQLSFGIDSLSKLYSNDSLQLSRIKSMNTLLKERDRLFINYLKVREGLLNNNSFSNQVEELNALVDASSKDLDSLVLRSEKRTLTTTIKNTSENKSSDGPKTFFGKLFGKKKDDKNNQSFNIMNEELDVKVDTVALSRQDSIIQNVEKTIRQLEEAQRKKSEVFINREAVLASTSDLLINKMLTVLREVESEAVKQIEINNKEAREVVNDSIKQISIIIIVFFLATVILLYFILSDIAKSNQYRKDLELAKEEAEYHSLAKQRFLSNMSHEIRTPLQAIIGYSELIRKQENPRKKDIEAIYHSSEHLMQIVNEVLDYNRIVSGKLTFSHEVFNMQKLLTEVLSVMHLQAEKKELKIVQDFDIDDDLWVEGDAFRLKQILYNLLSNAIKFTHAGMVSIAVSYKKQAHDVHFMFVVEDTGIGMTKDEVKLIFNEFEQANNPQNKEMNKAGAGLGLSIVKALVETQEGRIHVKSTPSKGSSFTVYLKFREVNKPQEDSVLGLKNTLLSTAFSGKVWIVDDDQFILDLCALIFAHHQIAYQCFSSPEEALKADITNDVKFIFLDMRMPGMSGITLCKKLKEKIQHPDVLIYALTAQVLPEETAQVVNNGFDGLLMKPFKEEQLLSILINGNLTFVEVENQNHSEFDLTALEKMTFGDWEQTLNILNRFMEDSHQDIKILEANIQQQNLEEAGLVSHRIAGRVAQVGARPLAALFREQELLLQDAKHWDESFDKTLHTLIKQLKLLMDELDKLKVKA